MAHIIPIRGLRYNPAIVKDLSLVVTPPYDVIDTEAQTRYYERHPYNIIRLEYNRIYPGDDEHDNRYVRAAATFREWRARGVFVREEKPALYLYEQQVEFGGRTYTRHGFFGAIRLEPYSTGMVLPHEETLPHAKRDRFKLLRACRANFSPVFGLYAEKELETVQILSAAAGPEPAAEFRDELGQAHRLWPVTDPKAINRVLVILQKYPVFIADGHHRYETALAYKEACNRPGLQNCVMIVLVSLYDPGLLILPTHRLVKSPLDLDPATLPARLEAHFDVQPFAGGFREFLAALGRRPKHSFGLYSGAGRLHLLSLKPTVDLDRLMPTDRSPNWRQLDVTVLHQLVLGRLLGIGSDKWADEEFLKYTRKEEAALDRVDAGEFDCAFFLNPPGVEELVAVAGDGERMPQKSTYFYPKLSTGLVINPFD
ncbi:MAG: DUF1015 domain-containing protein [Candidatus Desulforudis sp.]|nr:DUF1015 domain-containing protein [Desulforudis sp.]